MEKIDEETKTLRGILIKIRDDVKNDRALCCKAVLEYLYYENESTFKMVQFDAFLIKAIHRRFKETQDADIVLMAFGLLREYDYHKFDLKDRRFKYLRESDYVCKDKHGRIESFADADEERQISLANALGNGPEKKRIGWLAEFLLEQDDRDREKFIEEVSDYIEIIGGKQFAKLPEPNYLKNNRRVQNKTSNSSDTEHISDTDCNPKTNQKPESKISKTPSPESIIPESDSIDSLLVNNITQEKSESENSASGSIAETNKPDQENIALRIEDSSQIFKRIKNIINIQKYKKHILKTCKWLVAEAGLACIIAFCIIPVIQNRDSLNVHKDNTAKEDAPLVEEIYVFNNKFELPVGEAKELDIRVSPPDADASTVQCISENADLARMEGHIVRAQSKDEWRDEVDHTATIIAQGGRAEVFYIKVTVINPWVYKYTAKDNAPTDDTGAGEFRKWEQ